MKHIKRHWPHHERHVSRLGIHQQCMHKARQLFDGLNSPGVFSCTYPSTSLRGFGRIITTVWVTKKIINLRLNFVHFLYHHLSEKSEKCCEIDLLEAESVIRWLDTMIYTHGHDTSIHLFMIEIYTPDKWYWPKVSITNSFKMWN